MGTGLGFVGVVVEDVLVCVRLVSIWDDPSPEVLPDVGLLRIVVIIVGSVVVVIIGGVVVVVIIPPLSGHSLQLYLRTCDCSEACSGAVSVYGV